MILLKGSTLPSEHRFASMLMTFEKYFSKILIETHTIFATHWVPVLGSYLHFSINQLRSPALFTPPMFLEKQSVVFMTFIKQIIKCSHYSNGTEGWKAISDFSQNPEAIIELYTLLVLRYIILTQEDLATWKESPELFLHEEDLDAYTIKKRPMAENLSLDLLRCYKGILVPVVLRMLTDSRTAQTLPQILVKDAVYSAVLWASDLLYEEVNFPNWFTNQLLPELQSKDPNFVILHRKIVLMIGEWVNTISPQIRQTVYSVVAAMLSHSDLVICLTAALTLSLLMKDLQFEKDLFTPYLDKTLKDTFRIISVCESTDTKLKLLDVLGSIIDRMPEQIRPYTKQILDLTSQVWQKFQSEKMMKSAVIRLLTTLVNTLGDTCEFQDIFVPVLENSINVDSPDSSYILEEGLELWIATAKHARQLSENYLNLFSLALKNLARGYDNIFKLMKILEYYIILGKGKFLQVFINDLEIFYRKIIGDTKERATIHILKPLELLVFMFPIEIPQVFETVLQKVVYQLLFDPEESTRSKVYYVSVLCRLLLHNPEFFLTFLNKTGAASNPPIPNLLNLFLSGAIDKIENTAERNRRKLVVFSIVSLLSVPIFNQDPSMLDNIIAVIHHAIGVMQDEDTPDPEAQVYPSASSDDDEEAGALDSPWFSHNPEWVQISSKDPINLITTRNLLQDKIMQLRNIAPKLLETILQNIPTLLQDLSNKPL
eukprot:TRINITY_DN10341_c0_g1_i2.p1 TRINITY_DN10341_c0_g1~~TRINITY_DN10341_c0_g1_i2.p1  ORF type:complete len:714 (-),score=180.86 TRINITY_DN10341_c0_g1_i2:129-2270(-)